MSRDKLRAPSAATVRRIVLVTIALTLVHFTDNAVNVDTYPKASWQPEWFDVAAGAVVIGSGVWSILAHRASARDA